VEAFGAVCVTGIPLGLAMGYNPRVKAVFDPIIEFYRPIPPLAYLMVLIVWLGIGEMPKVTLLYLVGLPPVVVSASSAVAGVRVERIHGARSLGANDWQVFRYVIFPSCLPQIFAGMRLAFGVSYSALVAAEMIAASSGLGWTVRHSGQFLRTDMVFVGIFIMAFTAYLAELILRMAQQRLVPWAGKG
jgi:taurine transport system permease protein